MERKQGVGGTGRRAEHDFGRPIGSFQALADLATELEAARLMNGDRATC